MPIQTNSIGIFSVKIRLDTNYSYVYNAAVHAHYMIVNDSKRYTYQFIYYSR